MQPGAQRQARLHTPGILTCLGRCGVARIRDLGLHVRSIAQSVGKAVALVEQFLKAT